VKPSREYLKQLDPAVYDILCKIVYEPETVLRPVLVEPIMALQASLRVGGELHDNLLNE
jgi:hypothetical protein